MFRLGMDIGYSNLKIVYGEDAESLTKKLLPIGAGPLDLLPKTLSGEGAAGLQVLIDGQQWVAGVEPERLQGWDRELHADYSSTDAYRALFYAALLCCERDIVDVLVTGLPVSQFGDKSFVQQLVKRLTGTFQITPKRSVEVKKVIVVPQPAGSYLDICSTADKETREIINEGRTLVLDPGFFSVDWVVLIAGEIRMHSSGTSLKAMSVLLADADQRIQGDFGAAPGVATLEKAIRAGREHVLVLGKRVEILPYLSAAAQVTAKAALVPMRQSMREESGAIDTVMLAGGGALSYKTAAIEVFPKSRILVSENPVMANAYGFWCASNPG